MHFNITLWRVRVTLVTMETQQCFHCLLLSCMTLSAAYKYSELIFGPIYFSDSKQRCVCVGVCVCVCVLMCVFVCVC